MEILFCGTGAAEGFPALFCECETCNEARSLGGKERRSRAAYMLGERVRIDFGPDSNLHQYNYGLDFQKLEHLLMTHSHDDHWFPTDIGYRQKGFSTVSKTLQVWGNDKVEKRFTEEVGMDWSKYFLEFHRVTPFAAIDLGEGLRAIPILAAHDRSEACLNYLLETEGKRVLLGHDTGWWDAETWDFLNDKPIDLLILDCTYGVRDHDRNHMGGMALIRFREELRRRGAIASGAKSYATHFSHNCGSNHDELTAFFADHDFIAAYDGLRLSL